MTCLFIIIIIIVLHKVLSVVLYDLLLHTFTRLACFIWHIARSVCLFVCLVVTFVEQTNGEGKEREGKGNGLSSDISIRARGPGPV